MTAGGPHYAEHFNRGGYCQCGCDDCHLRLTGGCVCPDCPCDDPADERHEADLRDTPKS